MTRYKVSKRDGDAMKATPRPLDLYKAKTWLDAGDNLPCIVTITKRMKDGTIYYRGLNLLDGSRWELGAKYKADPDYFTSQYDAITTDDLMRRLAYRQQDHSQEELLANRQRKGW